jgi:hypothetical protein
MFSEVTNERIKCVISVNLSRIHLVQEFSFLRYCGSKLADSGKLLGGLMLMGRIQHRSELQGIQKAGPLNSLSVQLLLKVFFPRILCFLNYLITYQVLSIKSEF